MQHSRAKHVEQKHHQAWGGNACNSEGRHLDLYITRILDRLKEIGQNVYMSPLAPCKLSVISEHVAHPHDGLSWSALCDCVLENIMGCVNICPGISCLTNLYGNLCFDSTAHATIILITHPKVWFLPKSDHSRRVLPCSPYPSGEIASSVQHEKRIDQSFPRFVMIFICIVE